MYTHTYMCTYIHADTDTDADMVCAMFFHWLVVCFIVGPAEANQ